VEQPHFHRHGFGNAFKLFLDEVTAILLVEGFESSAETPHGNFGKRLHLFLRGMQSVLEVQCPAANKLDQYFIGQAVHPFQNKRGYIPTNFDSSTFG